ncbi:hypothetical protein [Nonomuraea rubra]|uniref:hypothetical protein n=1 Tax=Nonomuraea rubra TaxID=46180 RepID=UPI003407A9AF
MTAQLRQMFAAVSPAITTAAGLTPEQNLARAHEFAARAECMIELLETPAREAAEQGVDPAEYVEADMLGVLYALAAMNRVQLALAGAKLNGPAE